MPKRIMLLVGIYTLSATLGWCLVGVLIGTVLQ